MSFSQPQIIGICVIGLVLLLVGWIAFRRQPRATQLFALVLGVAGLGYLATTPAPAEISKALFGQRY